MNEGKHGSSDMIKFLVTYRHTYRQYKDDDVDAIIRKLEDKKLFHLKVSRCGMEQNENIKGWERRKRDVLLK